MNLTDKCVLFGACLAAYLLEPRFGMDVAPILIAFSISCLFSYYEQGRMPLVLGSLFMGCSLVLPGLLFFIPLICYDLFYRATQKLVLAALIPILWHMDMFDVTMVFPCVLLAAAWLLRKRTTTQAALQRNYNLLRDTSREMALTLKRQNQELLEGQDERISLATLNERSRIAREIHDNVGHLLSSSLLQMGALLAVTKEPDKRQPLLDLRNTLSTAMDSIRQSVHNLYDESVDLYAQLQELTERFTFCELHFDYDIQSNLGKRQKYAIISIVKEALSNIVRHSDATFVKVVLREHPALYQLIVTDNGSVKDLNLESGIGLKNMETRVAALEGHMHLSVKEGFAVFISIPKGVDEE
ncbi:histidine kinase [Gorillibacterium sp. CAU 1737]|uniref:sensor histidine kinase n=1 Tax=Gorillibacterium sp. CAU 1737 TaxID=3140362 RepID=UPI003260245F